MTEIARIGVQVPAEPGPIDKIEAAMVEAGGKVRQLGEGHTLGPTSHRFTPGMYSRTIFMPAGSIFTSKIHKLEHQFVIMSGRCIVYTEGIDKWVEMSAPFVGVTHPGTRRLLYIIEDSIWTAFYPTNTTDLEELEREILVDYENPLISPNGNEEG